MADPLDLTPFGFPDPDSLRLGTTGLLAHFQRLGLHVLPAATGSLRGRLDGQLSHPEPEMRSIPKEISVKPGTAPAPSQPTQARPQIPAQRPQAVPQPQAQPPRPLERDRLAPAPAVVADATPYSLPVLSTVQREQTLQAGAAVVADCRQCAELVISRRRTVYGEGSVHPRVVFFGEAPGADEDRTGRPFVGKAGQLLDKMIQACTFKREDCYIMNTIKCRPPTNRNPQLDEVEHCRAYFEQQFDVLQPEYIVCLGLVAARALLHSPLPVGRLRGVFHQYRGSKVVVTYHPSYLLRTPEAKRHAWDDLQMMLKDMDINPQARN